MNSAQAAIVSKTDGNIYINRLFLNIGSNILGSIRTRRNTFTSRVSDITLQPAMNAANRLQLVSLSLSDATPRLQPRNTFAMPLKWNGMSMFKTLQLMAYWLSTSLRLNPIDVARVLNSVKSPKQSDRWFSWPMETGLPTYPPDDIFLSYVYRALAKIQKDDSGEQLASALGDNRYLAVLSESILPSAADELVFQKYLVCFSNTSNATRAARRLLSPSFFDYSLTPCGAHEHVHVLERSAVSHRTGIMLVFFEHMPTPHQIDAVSAKLKERFRPKGSKRYGDTLTTDPILYSNELRRQCGRLFRIDGMISPSYQLRVIGPAIRSLLLGRRVLESTPERQETSTGSRKDDHKRYHIVIWLRRSNHQKSNVGLQLWNIIRDLPDEVCPLEPNDCITIALELDSSIRYGWRDRLMPEAVLRQLRHLHGFDASYILTAHANRLTRQREDLKTIYNDIASFDTAWLFRQTKPIDDIPRAEDLFEQDVVPSETEAYAEDLEIANAVEWAKFDSLDSMQDDQQFNVGLGEVSFYGKCGMIAEAVVTTARNNHIIVELKRILRLALRHHKIERVVLYCRTSPQPGTGKDPGAVDFSIERQVDFLERMIPDDYVPQIVRHNCVSAYRDERDLSFITTSLQKTCIFTVSLDRMLRRHLEQVRKDLDGHFGVSLLWDWETNIEPLHALCLEDCVLPDCSITLQTWTEAMRSMRRFTPSPAQGALLQPVLWCAPLVLHHDTHIIRHVSRSENFCRGLSTGPPYYDQFAPIPKGCVIDTSHRMDNAELSRLRQFVQTYLNLEHVEMLVRDGMTSMNRCPHRRSAFCDVTTCTCDCPYCRDARACICTNSVCICEAICSCTCRNCKHGAAQEATATPLPKQALTVREPLAPIDSNAARPKKRIKSIPVQQLRSVYQDAPW